MTKSKTFQALENLPAFTLGGGELKRNTSCGATSIRNSAASVLFFF